MKRLCAVAAAFAVFAYSHVVLASTTSTAAGWAAGVSTTGQTIWFGPANQTKSSAAMGLAIWEAATTGGGAKLTTSASLAVGAGEAAVVAKGVVTGANVFNAFKSVVGGPLGLALLAAPPIVNWLLEQNIRSKPGTKDFEKLKDVPGYAIGDIKGLTQKDVCDSFVASNYPSSKYESYSGSTSSNQCLVTEVYKPEPPQVGWTDVIGRVDITTTPSVPADPTKPDSWLPKSMDDIAPYMTPRPTLPSVVGELLDKGASLPVTSPSVTGPATVTAPPVVSTTNNGTETTTSTKTTKSTQSYSTGSPSTGAPVAPKVTSTTNTTTVVTVTNNTTGNVINTTTNNTNNPTDPASLPTAGTDPAEPTDLETCGLPGKPKCLIDETGTPEAKADAEYDTKLEDYKTKTQELQDKTVDSQDKSLFNSGWSQAFFAPPIVACTGYVLPRDMGTLDPCPVVDGVRSVMAYIWAVSGLILSLRMIRQVM